MAFKKSNEKSYENVYFECSVKYLKCINSDFSLKPENEKAEKENLNVLSKSFKNIFDDKE